MIVEALNDWPFVCLVQKREEGADWVILGITDTKVRGQAMAEKDAGEPLMWAPVPGTKERVEVGSSIHTKTHWTTEKIRINERR